MKGKETLKKLGMTPDRAYAYKHSSFLFTPEYKRDLYSADLYASCRTFDPSAPFRFYYNRCESLDPLDKALYVDLKTYLADDILVKVDRMSMAHALEVRAPLLDHKLLEFTATIPSSLKLKGRTTKYLLKEVMQKYLPSRVFTRPKHGFTMPVGEWLKGPLRGMVEECLFSPRARQRGLFHPKAVQNLWSSHLSGKRDASHNLWMLLMLELWQREYLEGHVPH
jgi:asparagine synthase (glutamine-hydrolysing)